MPLRSADQNALATFIASLTEVPWLAHAGDRDEAAVVADNLVDAWDGWNPEMLSAWGPQTKRTEQIAVGELGEAGVDEVFGFARPGLALENGDRSIL